MCSNISSLETLVTFCFISFSGPYSLKINSDFFVIINLKSFFPSFSFTSIWVCLCFRVFVADLLQRITVSLMINFFMGFRVDISDNKIQYIT